MRVFGQDPNTHGAVVNRMFRIVLGLRLGFLLSRSATVPDTIGVAIDVPEYMAYPFRKYVE